ncbi:GNAT family N-acetyltransferase [Micromonospora echinofusca]|uniref:GNAT family N-acetyltransferase n=1 Tax=Micromonospora echinofusca TaxID=47858 RepID=A0ABS3VZ91_MICEH|nr:GNAT family N-acetyltransferase [Micromonospora echinofusca]
MSRPPVRIDPWCPDDLDLLRRINIPEMKRHLGGPETADQVLARHERYVGFSATGQGCMYRVVLLPGPTPAVGDDAHGAGIVEKVGSVGYFEKVWHDETIYELGWAILPPYQGRGLATAAVRAALDAARTRRIHRWAHAFPSVDNPASNAVCRRTGFELVGETDFEFPKGRLMRSHDWRIDLTAGV